MVDAPVGTSTIRHPPSAVSWSGSSTATPTFSRTRRVRTTLLLPLPPGVAEQADQARGQQGQGARLGNCTWVSTPAPPAEVDVVRHRRSRQPRPSPAEAEPRRRGPRQAGRPSVHDDVRRWQPGTGSPSCQGVGAPDAAVMRAYCRWLRSGRRSRPVEDTHVVNRAVEGTVGRRGIS